MASNLLSIGDVAARLGRSPETLRYWRRVNEGPPCYLLGRRLVYEAEDVERWIADERARQLGPRATA